MRLVSRIGELAVGKFGRMSYLAAMVFSATWMLAHPRTWRRTIYNVLSRQILFTGLEGVWFISFVALLVGVSIVLQVQLWLSTVGQSDLIGPLLVLLIFREVAPLLTNFVVIGRSGTAIATEVSTMKVTGELRTLDAMGLNPFIYIVIPRVIGVGLSVFCLAVVFVVVSLASGYLISLAIGANIGSPGVFIDSVMMAITPADIVNFVAKTLIPGLLTGAICCIEGFNAGHAITDIPKATTRALVHSVSALFVVSSVVSVLTYL